MRRNLESGDVDHLLDDNVNIKYVDEVRLDRLRYWCYRKQKTVVEGGRLVTRKGVAGKRIRAMLDAVETLDFFDALDGWRGFAVRWDVNEQLELYPRDKPQDVEYHEWLDRVAVPITLRPVTSVKAPAHQVERIEVYPTKPD